MHNSNLSADELLEQAKISIKNQDNLTARNYLRDYLTRQHSLIWLAHVSSDNNEALTAAELALCLNPDDEVAKRAIATVGGRANATLIQQKGRHELSAKIFVATGMTLGQARATNWPFENIHRPIGELLDDHTKTLKDLAWAFTIAKTPTLREATRTILLTHLLGAEPEQGMRPVRVIDGSRYNERRERSAISLAGLSAGAAITLFGVALILGVVNFWQPLPLLLVLIIYLLLVVSWLLGWQLNRSVQEARNFQVGRWGEEKIVEQLRAILDDRWTIVRNVVWGGRTGGDIDLVLLGPGGILAFEVKTYAGAVRNIGDTWERQTKRGWQTLQTHPGKQARRNAAALQGFLKAHNIAVDWVQPVVLWASSKDNADQQGQLVVENPKTPVLKIEMLDIHNLELVQHGRTLSNELVTQIAELLRETVAITEREQKNKK